MTQARLNHLMILSLYKELLQYGSKRQRKPDCTR